MLPTLRELNAAKDVMKDLYPPQSPLISLPKPQGKKIVRDAGIQMPTFGVHSRKIPFFQNLTRFATLTF